MCKKSFLFSLLLLLSTLEARVSDEFVEQRAEDLRYNKSIRAFMHDNKRMTHLVHNSYAHIVFPSIGKGGAVLAYAYGEGRAYLRGGIWIGDVSVSQYSIGVQAGGQAYSEIIFFKTYEAFEEFKKGGLVNSTQASLVPFVSGLSGDVNFADDVEVYTSSTGGFMLDASTGAQSFEYLQR